MLYYCTTNCSSTLLEIASGPLSSHGSCDNISVAMNAKKTLGISPTFNTFIINVRV